MSHVHVHVHVHVKKRLPLTAYYLRLSNRLPAARDEARPGSARTTALMRWLVITPRDTEHTMDSRGCLHCSSDARGCCVFTSLWQSSDQRVDRRSWVGGGGLGGVRLDNREHEGPRWTSKVSRKVQGG